VAFGGADNRGEGVLAGVRLRFEVWQKKEVGFLLHNIWFRVFGLRRELYEFMILWAIVSMLRSTQTVDMETTRKDNFGRVQEAVLNPILIPEQLDVVIGDHYFEVEFEVVRLGFDENGEEEKWQTRRRRRRMRTSRVRWWSGLRRLCCPDSTRVGRWLTGSWRLRLFLRLTRDRPGQVRGCSGPGMSMSWLRPRGGLLIRT
jgi:hypothetical protein